MRIAMIGVGYVGLVSGACFAEFGHDVTCIDVDPKKIAMLEAGGIPIYEPGLDALVEKNVKAGRLTFTTSLEEGVLDKEAIFIAVGTPTRRGDGHADLTYVFAAGEAIAKALKEPTVVVTKSTVPVGTGRKLKELFARVRPDLKIDIASNPEFLREGSAIEDFMRPDRVVCGVDSEAAREAMRGCYRPLNTIEVPILFTSLETSELIKYATNSFLATKITFINEMADLCEKVGADVNEVARGMGLDGRIGRKFLHAGPGYGGSCFPKDTLALVRTAEQNGVDLRIVESTINVNEMRKRRMVRKIVDAMGGSVAGKTIAVLGVTFKPNTDDMRDAPSLVVLPSLKGEGATIRAYDPEGKKEAEKLLPEVLWARDPYEAVEGADAIVVLTEWNEFRGLDLDRIRQMVAQPRIIDLRNIFNPAEVAQRGFSYTSIGRPSVGPAV
ncbi:MAG TPA: UDP-glucose/GDP-mannose dehydrogenase family protein [Geminicoccus sp.]|jgi:UDPglucose 6-dehydrogenase|uniref:UDP-glucose dehydrogenase family protein n=1 Tax=Geminicoccus sp. TaxID=2024832 RepID=UPI002E36F81F|nr:UDP-glucose/GDP-mannose dehydrogenase family protein [Geminicoccus sp.]HEX2529500.1 UDP-glucose/GDP-mannose dehydrogenase family protein [Geminicoccus sp.]